MIGLFSSCILLESTVMPVLVLDRLAKNPGGLPVLHDLSLEVQPGARRVILSPASADKTTLLHLTALQLAGQVYVMSKGRNVYVAPLHLLAQNVEMQAQYLGI
jgi:ABC-type branched-subunit amino acid transport system ATPase component